MQAASSFRIGYGAKVRAAHAARRQSVGYRFARRFGALALEPALLRRMRRWACGPSDLGYAEHMSGAAQYEADHERDKVRANSPRYRGGVWRQLLP